MSMLKVAVVGCGSMGSNHARVYSTLSDTELVAVVDPDAARAKALAEHFDCVALTHIDQLPADIDAASIAVPATRHAEVGLALLRRGIHCLMEKPLASTEAECLELIETANDARRVLLVGHIEQFNPAVRTLFEILPPQSRILSIESRRLSWVPDRAGDVNVLLDLMVHDLDIILTLMKSEVTGVQAMRPRHNGLLIDHVTSLCQFANGATATLTASKVTQNKIRDLAVLTDHGLYMLDFPRQEIVIYRQGEERGDIIVGHYKLDVVMERVFIRQAEPLMREIEHFVACCRGTATPLVSGGQALTALRAIWEMQAQIGQN